VWSWPHLKAKQSIKTLGLGNNHITALAIPYLIGIWSEAIMKRDFYKGTTLQWKL
jgi:hypothetical protein